MLDGVALRKESVDRNVIRPAIDVFLAVVALRKESVDRNCYLDNIEISEASRSPQGERG